MLKELNMEENGIKPSQDIRCSKMGSYLFQRSSLSSSSEEGVMSDGTMKLSPASKKSVNSV
jgi:hypothetical protein